MKTLTQITEAITANKGETTNEISIMGTDHTHPNRTHIYARPSYRADHQGTPFAGIETQYTYRGDTWTVEATAYIEVPRWFEKTERAPRLNFTIDNAYNLTARRTYGRYDRNSNLSDAQTMAALTALSTITDTTPPKDTYTGTPMKTAKRDVLTMIENAAADTLNETRNVRSFAHQKGTAYANDYRTTANNAVRDMFNPNHYKNSTDTDNIVYGHTITDTDQQRIVNRLIANHKRELTARAKAL